MAALTARCWLRNSVTRSALTYRRPYSQSPGGPPPPKPASRQTFAGERLYKHEIKPTDFDKKILLWTKRYKKAEDIPEYVTWEAISSARSNMRVKICMAMIAATLIGCIFMVRSGKQALKEDRTLLQKNMERKAKWKEEAEQERNAALKSQ